MTTTKAEEPITAAYQVRVLLIDDHELTREGIAHVVRDDARVQLVGQVATIGEGLEIVKSTRVDVVLLHIDLGQMHPGWFLKLAPDAGFAGGLLVITAGVNRADRARLLEEGCSGVYIKGEPLSRLIERIQAVAKSPSGAPLQREAEMELPTVDSGKYPPLTPQEREVLRGAFAGRTNKEIADILGVPEPTVKLTVRQLFRKAGVHSRSQLIGAALERYWQDLE